MQLESKVALITGAGVRIGRALALALAERGARIVVHYHASEGPAAEVVRQIRALGSEGLALQADLRKPASIQPLVDEGSRHFGQLDILINSAAIFERGTILETTEANWDAHLAINLKAPFFLCQAYARQLNPGQRGHILNIADWRAERPGVAHIAYTCAKAGLVALTKSLALALAPNVQVNAIAPGAILPPPGDEGGYFEKLAGRIPAKRVGSPAELVKAALFLLDSDFVTGELVHVTGGQHL
jgi:pteridine reductase